MLHREGVFIMWKSAFIIKSALLYILLMGCGEEVSPPEVLTVDIINSTEEVLTVDIQNPSEVVTVDITDWRGLEATRYVTIQVVFSKEMKEVVMSVSGTTGSAWIGVDSRAAYWNPSDTISAGEHELTIRGKDTAGNELANCPTVYFKIVLPPDTTPPLIDGANCEPRNGETGVDPAEIEASDIRIVFSEPMSQARLDSFDPKDVKVDARFDGDRTLVVSLLPGSKLSNEIEVRATVSGVDKAGNAIEPDESEYSFTTM